MTAVLLALGSAALFGGMTVALRRPSGRRPLKVEAVPLAHGAERVALLIAAPGERAASKGDLMRRFDITRAEASLWSGLVSGATLGEIAERGGVSINTLRVQLAALFRKLGVHRQVDLVRLALE